MRKLIYISFYFLLLFSACEKNGNGSGSSYNLVNTNCLCEDGILASNSNLPDSLILYVPNCFTPNNDNINDQFHINVNYRNIANPNSSFINTSTAYDLHINGTKVRSKGQTAVAYSIVGEVISSANHWNGVGYPEGVYSYSIDVEVITPYGNIISHQRNGKVSVVRNPDNLGASFSCVNAGKLNCTFPDMIDPLYGFIYPTQEYIDNWN